MIPMLRTPSVRLAVLAVVALLALGACGGGGSAVTPPSRTLLPATADALPTFDAHQFDQLIAQLHGTPVVVNIWASWCGPCVREAPELAAVASSYQGKVQFVGIDIEDQRGPARQFIARFGWRYPSVSDPTGAIRDAFGLIGAPHTIFFDASGQQMFVYSGAVSQEALVTHIEEALRRGSPPGPSSAGGSPTGY
jgi:thiol-disulfide isomerase/thioredoxin